MRISRPHMWMDAAEVFSRRSTCARANIGALVVDPKAKDIVSVGYNGPPPGSDHCYGDFCQRSDNGGCLRSIHAEKNAIMRAIGKLRISRLVNHHLYCTFSPCYDCALLIDAMAMPRVFYRYSYRLRDGIELLLKKPYVEIYKVTNSGIITRERDGKIYDGESL